MPANPEKDKAESSFPYRLEEFSPTTVIHKTILVYNLLNYLNNHIKSYN